MAGVISGILFMLALNSWGVSLDVEQKETIQRTLEFSNPSAAKEVNVDNVFGSIHVAGYNGRSVHLLVNQTIRAVSKEKIEVARKEVKLDISEKDNVLRLYVDGPFRCQDGSLHSRGPRYYGYEVNYDFELKVPQDAGLRLYTVNGGDIKVENVSGDFDVDNINGSVEMNEVSGSGRAYALNGRMKTLFRENPRSSCYFGSLNGNVEISFRPGLSADVKVKTFNGAIYSDFPVTYLPNATPAGERRNGRFVYRNNGFSSIRIGNGGPEIKLEGFNGTIRILQREK
ncbi:MAG TPA: hypothetical protein VGK99_16580 [Acidobacteriota bacterium]|jgi:hypothetical protein